MRLSVTLDLPTDARAAAQLLADPEYVHQKVRASGALEQHVDVTGDPSGPSSSRSPVPLCGSADARP